MYVYMYVGIFFYLFEHAPLLWSNVTCFKFTCYRTSVLIQGIMWRTSNLIASAAACHLQW